MLRRRSNPNGDCRTRQPHGFYFTQPYHTFVISRPDEVLALVVFVVVSAVVGLAARRTREAARAGADAEVLFNLAGKVLRGEHALTDLLGRLRETFGQESVTLLEHHPGTQLTPARQRDAASWHVAAAVGGEPCAAPDDGDTGIPVGEDLALMLRGRPLPAADRRILEAFAAQAAAALRQQRLAEEAERTRLLAEAGQVRTALLSAVSHDLRSPLSSAMAAVESLANPAITWTGEERAELVATARESLERLHRLVANLLDMSRLQAGVLGVYSEPLALEDILPRVLDDLGPQGCRIRVSLPDDLPEVLADPALLERILADLAANAVRYSPAGEQVLLTASGHDNRVDLRIADRGPGIPPEHRDRVFPALPAARRPGQPHRRRSWPRPGPRAHRGHERNPRPRRHTRRWPDHGPYPARRRDARRARGRWHRTRGQAARPAVTGPAGTRRATARRGTSSQPASLPGHSSLVDVVACSGPLRRQPARCGDV